MNKWTDPFTGVIYRYGDGWANKVRRHLAALLANRLSDVASAKEAADKSAKFWQDYYGFIFPLRFGRGTGEEAFTGQDLFGPGKEIDLEQHSNRALRDSFIGAGKLPPLLTAETPSASGSQELIADHHLVCAALCNLILRARGKDQTDLFHQTRLGVLVHELADEHELKGLASFANAIHIARFLKNGGGELPAELDREWLDSIHTEHLRDDCTIALVGIGAQRIKQFVFESPGLNEIRGASTLLDDSVDALSKEVCNEIGPEVVLRAAAATLQFLAPGRKNNRGQEWTEHLRERFFEKTHTSSVAAAAIEVPPSRLLTEYRHVLGEFQSALECDRYQPDLPVTESLPFEVRCSLCGHRAADDWEPDADGQYFPICHVCKEKRDVGRDGRRGKVRDVLTWLELKDPGPLGVSRNDFVANDLSELMPKGAKRKRLAIIYGDGNNFGGVVAGLSSLALSLQWTHRVEKVTEAAVALGLARATTEASRGRTNLLAKLPFQILSLGGDDLSIITWSKIGLRVCEQFLRLTDLEFQRADGPSISDKRLAFSLGASFCDDKAPVRRTVEFAEDDLLKWAKRAARVKADARGNLAFHLALTAEQIPADLRAYRSEMYFGGGDHELCLTMRPFTADELKFLLGRASKLKAQRLEGPLHNVVGAFVQSAYPMALLHYYYQKAREQRGGPELPKKGFFAQLEGRVKPQEPSEWEALFGGFPLVGIQAKKPKNFLFEWWAAKPSARLPFGEEDHDNDKVAMLSPLWDLYEIAKILE